MGGELRENDVVICIGVGRWCDGLTVGKEYKVLKVDQKEESIQIEDDNGELFFFKTNRFKWVYEPETIQHPCKKDSKVFPPPDQQHK